MTFFVSMHHYIKQVKRAAHICSRASVFTAAVLENLVANL